MLQPDIFPQLRRPTRHAHEIESCPVYRRDIVPRNLVVAPPAPELRRRHIADEVGEHRLVRRHAGCARARGLPTGDFPAVCGRAMKFPAAFLSFALLLAGCASIHTELTPHADLGKFKRFFVEHRLADNHHIDDLIVADLRSRGLSASDGPLTMLSDDAEAVITYEDDWTWDFKSYLIELRIAVRRARTDEPLAAGTYRQPSPITKSPPAVVHEILDRLFKKS